MISQNKCGEKEGEILPAKFSSHVVLFVSVSVPVDWSNLLHYTRMAFLFSRLQTDGDEATSAGNKLGHQFNMLTSCYVIAWNRWGCVMLVCVLVMFNAVSTADDPKGCPQIEKCQVRVVFWRLGGVSWPIKERKNTLSWLGSRKTVRPRGARAWSLKIQTLILSWCSPPKWTLWADFKRCWKKSGSVKRLGSQIQVAFSVSVLFILPDFSQHCLFQESPSRHKETLSSVLKLPCYSCNPHWWGVSIQLTLSSSSLSLSRKPHLCTFCKAHKERKRDGLVVTLCSQRHVLSVFLMPRVCFLPQEWESRK